MNNNKKIIVDKEKLKELLEKSREMKEQIEVEEEIQATCYDVDCYFYVPDDYDYNDE